jgi:fatty aldehyde-generating acyl-ACP reductase
MTDEGLIDFALIGHQDDWRSLEKVIAALRDPALEPLDRSTVRDIVRWIPPRVIGRVLFTSGSTGRRARGVYIDTLITPDELASSSRQALLGKVRTALDVAVREGAALASLGGFTSIFLEAAHPPHLPNTIVVTTGNTLTSGYIVRGVERAARYCGVDLSSAAVLIIGATGDIGSACARYLSTRVGRLLLCARNQARLDRLSDELRFDGAQVAAGAAVHDYLPRADIVIAVASVTAPTFDPALCHSGAIVCDAGYPKNLTVANRGDVHLFWGGMGQAIGWSEAGLLSSFYRFPSPNVGHGCMLEGVALALEGRVEAYSTGRGHITPDRIDEMLEIAERHGMGVAPLFNRDRLWDASSAPPVVCAHARGMLL